MRALLLILAAASLSAQSRTVGMVDIGISSIRIASSPVAAYAPVVSATASSSIQPHSGTGMMLGITQQSGNPGDSVSVISYGRVTCNFGSVSPVIDNTAILVGPLCVDSGFTGRSNIDMRQAVAGRVNNLRPDLCANCADVYVISPYDHGTMVPYAGLNGSPFSSITVNNDGTVTYTASNGAVITTPASLTGPQGPTGTTGSQGSTGASGPTGPQGASYSIGGAAIFAISTHSANYTATSSDYSILMDTSSGSLSCLLPATPTSGQILNIKKISTLNTLTINGNGNNIDGSATLSITALNQSASLQYLAGIGWEIL